MYQAWTATPIYQADGLLQVEEQSTNLAELEVNAIFDDYTPTSAEIEILKSRSVLGAVVDELKMQIVAAAGFHAVHRCCAEPAQTDERKAGNSGGYAGSRRRAGRTEPDTRCTR